MRKTELLKKFVNKKVESEEPSKLKIIPNIHIAEVQPSGFIQITA